MRRNAPLFVLISLLSGLGSTAMTLAAGIWVLDLTSSVALAALTGLCVYAPTFGAPWLGTLVDRLPRRPLLITVDALLGSLILTLLLVSSPGSIWLIYAVLLARGLSYVLLDAGESAILPSALPPRLLGDVNGWRSSAQEGMKIVAPLLGAGVYAWRGPTPVVLICATAALLSAGCYALLRLPPAPVRTSAAIPIRIPDAAPTRISAAVPSPPVAAPAAVPATPASAPAAPASAPALSAPAPTAPALSAPALSAPALFPPATVPPDISVFADISGANDRGASRGGPSEDWSGRGEVRAGLHALFGNPAVRGPILVAAAAIGLSGLVNAAVIAQVVHGLHLPATSLGFLSTAQGIGSIVSGLLVGRLLARRSARTVARLGTAIFAAACVSSAIPWWPAMIGGRALAGFGLVLALIAGVTAVQTRTPDHLLGRVSATSSTVMFGPVAVAIPLGSALVQFGPVPLFLTAAALAAAAACYRPRPTVAETSPAIP